MISDVHQKKMNNILSKDTRFLVAPIDCSKTTAPGKNQCIAPQKDNETDDITIVQAIQVRLKLKYRGFTIPVRQTLQKNDCPLSFFQMKNRATSQYKKLLTTESKNQRIIAP